MVRSLLYANIFTTFAFITNLAGTEFIQAPHSQREHRLVSMESVDLGVAEHFADRDRLGHHLVVDFFGCNPEKLKYLSTVESIMLAAAKEARATVVASKFHQFNPFGVSGAVILSESHLAMDSWPEVGGYCAVDIFTCGNTDNFAAINFLKKEFEAQGYVMIEVERGKQRSHLNQEESGDLVFRENLDPLNGMKATIAIDKVLEKVTTEYQTIELFAAKSKELGYVLTIDGIIQLTSFDNAAYHEMITHVPLQAHANAKKVLIIGGGDGGALAELVKYPELEEIVVCDIDPMVAAVATKYFPAFAKAYQDPRVRAVYQDGAKFVANFKDYFDVIIVDCTDFYGVASSLARQEFYDSIATALTQEGILVVQGESMFYDKQFIADLYQQVKRSLPIVDYYNALVPTYPSGSIGFVFGSKKFSACENLGKRFSELGELFYYNEETHKASFAHPPFLKKALAGN